MKHRWVFGWECIEPEESGKYWAVDWLRMARFDNRSDLEQDFSWIAFPTYFEAGRGWPRETVDGYYAPFVYYTERIDMPGGLNKIDMKSVNSFPCPMCKKFAAELNVSVALDLGTTLMYQCELPFPQFFVCRECGYEFEHEDIVTAFTLHSWHHDKNALADIMDGAMNGDVECVAKAKRFIEMMRGKK